MPAYKDSKTGTWFVKFYCKDWTGENKQIKKRGFATKREALDYERNYKIRQENNLDMTFGEFWKLYIEDMKNMTFKISVIMPVYNAEDELNTAIDSIINQSFGFENIELIIVDDCSTDNSRNIITDYANEYENIIPVFLDENSGLPGKPRSLGIKYASADYISFLDSDDEYLKDGLKNLYDTILSEDSDFVIGSHVINLDGDKVKVKFLQSDEKLVNLNPLESQEIFDSLSLNFVAPWGKMFKKELILDNNITFPEDTLCEDTYFYFKALINSNKISVLPNTQVYMYNTFEHKKTAIHGLSLIHI